MVTHKICVSTKIEDLGSRNMTRRRARVWAVTKYVNVGKRTLRGFATSRTEE